MSEKTQIFSTDSTKRWERIKWLSRILSVVFILAASCVIISIAAKDKPALPPLFNKYKDAIAQDTSGKIHNTADKKMLPLKKNSSVRPNVNQLPFPFNNRLRSAFFVNWDVQSYYSLRDNITKLNMVMPEWMQLPDNADTVLVKIDARTLNLLKKYPNIKVVPMLTNYFNDKWNGGNVSRIIHDETKRKIFIESILTTLRKYGFNGINLDFEAFDTEKTNEYITLFQKELYTALHKEGFLVTQDIQPLNEDYDIAQLQKYNDLLYVMAYDQHNANSEPGDISPYKWVKQIVEDISTKVPPEKLVLCIAGYAYDWGKKGALGDEITFQEAIAIAKESESQIEFNKDSFNLGFKYDDSSAVTHFVGFTDAVTNFNVIRVADDAGWRGTALWRLGAEDPRLWSFYDKDLSKAALEKNNFDISTVKSSLLSSNVDYIGEGEILDVLSTPKEGIVTFKYDSIQKMITEETFQDLPTSYVVRKFGKAVGKKMVLTFDDGPDPEWTPQILDILEREKVPATFFIVGKNAEENLPVLKRIFNEGFEIGNHSFTHPNMADISEFRAGLELNATRLLLEIVTGRSTILFRAPYLADAEPETQEELRPVMLAKKQNYLTMGESLDPQDWDAAHINADSIVNRLIREKDYGSTILLHDAGGNRQATVDALPRIIKYFRDNGYEFITIAELMNTTKDELMPLVPKDKAFLDRVDAYILSGIYFLQKTFSGVFYTAVVLSMLRNLFILILAFLQKRKEKMVDGGQLTVDGSNLKPKSIINYQPLVSIIVPAYNEQITAVKTIKSLLLQDYPNYDIIFVNDGSKDETYEVVKAAFENNPKVKILTKPNGGKASALNYGIANSTAEILVNIDADTQLLPNAVTELIKKMSDDRVGAVAGNVKVGNKVNWLTRWQSVEYITSQNFDRLAMEYLNAITVVPGAIGAFRKSAIEEIGGYMTDTLAEDCDVTIRLLRNGWKVVSANNAIAITEAPETVSQFMKQRFRWCFGVMQAFWKNRDTLFVKKYKGLGMIAMPNILIFQLILPIFAPFADLILLLSLLAWSIGAKILIFYLAFMLVDIFCGYVAFRFQGESARPLWMLIPQRFVYRPIMYVVLYRSYRKAVKGELQLWGILKRTGNVSV